MKNLNAATDVAVTVDRVLETVSFAKVLSSSFAQNHININSGSIGQFASGGFNTTYFDGPPTSFSSSVLFDATYGHSSASLLAGFSGTFENFEKQRMYSEMASHLLGSGSYLFNFSGTVYNELFFLLPRRRVLRDEIAKGTVLLNLWLSGATPTPATFLSVSDRTGPYFQGPAGDWSYLYSGSVAVGGVYYQAGVIALATGALFPVGTGGQNPWTAQFFSGSSTLQQTLISGNIDSAVEGFINETSLKDFRFAAQSNLMSTVFFCRALFSEFNYSSNPTFVDSQGRIIPTSGSTRLSQTYFTSVGLYDVNNNLLAIAKLSKPVKKTSDSEVVIATKVHF